MTELWILPCSSPGIPPLHFNLCIIDLPLNSQNSSCLVVCVGVLFSCCLVHSPWHSCICVLRQTSNVVEKAWQRSWRSANVIILPCSSTKPSCGSIIVEPARKFAYDMLHEQKHMTLQISLTQVLIALNRPPYCGGGTEWLLLQCLRSVLISPAERCCK